MTFDEALSYLLSLGHETLTIKLGLANTETLLEALGNPQQDYPAVQIAGTNGKGSTAAFLDSICRAAGVRTGLFTSPHLISITERIRINGRQISNEDFARLTNQVKTTADQLMQSGKLPTLPTFFEHVTAIALAAFREAKIDLAILETGLGGRLDSTTAAQAGIVAITQIAMDHEEYLGHTIEEIAAEKAAIIRTGVTAIIAPQDQRALDVINRRSEAVGVEPQTVDPKAIEDATIGLRGRHQMVNAAAAVAVVEALRQRGTSIPRSAILEGLRITEHAGRLELWNMTPPILFDGAHNPASARALRDYLDEFIQQPITMIFGAMRDKRLTEIAATLFPKANRLILTGIDNPRAASLDDLENAMPPNFDRAAIRTAASPHEALQLAGDLTNEEGLILITGSLYLVGAIQEILKRGSHHVARLKAEH
jgi:dihydrofolate synthase/folylpolyglutamate synthase